MGSLIIIPATTAMYLARSLRSMQIIAVTTAVSSTLIGDAVASRFDVSSGPIIIMVAAVLFLASLFWRGRARAHGSIADSRQSFQRNPPGIPA